VVVSTVLYGITIWAKANKNASKIQEIKEWTITEKKTNPFE
jgi:hypothetical protein